MVRGREASGYSASMDASTEPLWLPVKAYVAEQMPLAAYKSNCANAVNNKKTRALGRSCAGQSKSMEGVGKRKTHALMVTQN